MSNSQIIIFVVGLLMFVWLLHIFNQRIGWPWRPEGYHGHKRKRHFRLIVHFHNLKNNHLMANSVTLTDLLPHKGVISVVDQNGNSYAGKLSNIQVTSSDSLVDTTSVDPNDPNTIDVTAVTKTGGSTIKFTADFTPDTSIDGKTSFTGLQGLATIVNNVTTQLSLQVNF